MSFSVVVNAFWGVPRSACFVELSPQYSQQSPLPAVLEQHVEQAWKAKAASPVRLFNALKFRFQNGVSDQHQRKVSLQLGLTDYKHHIASLSNSWNNLAEKFGEQVCPNVLGCIGIIETSDNKIILQQRSKNVAEYPEAYALPGGHPEPSRIGLTFDDWSKPNRTDPERVVGELFISVEAEIAEEVGIPLDAIENPLFIAVIKRNDHSRYSLVFVVRCRLTSTTIAELFCSGAAVDQFETTSLLAWETDQESLRQLVLTHQLPGCSVGALQVYQQYRAFSSSSQ